jgi:hypothetical protein
MSYFVIDYMKCGGPQRSFVSHVGHSGTSGIHFMTNGKELSSRKPLKIIRANQRRVKEPGVLQFFSSRTE